jgi:hypothetical protein
MKLHTLRVLKLKHFILVAGVGTPYIFLLVTGSFLVDDWGQLASGRTYIEHVKEWEALWAYRPVSWILIPAILQVFSDNFILVTLFHFSLFFFAIFQIIVWPKLNFNNHQRKLAVILLATPLFSSTFLLSPVNQLSASFSLFFFALGLMFEKKTLSNRRPGLIVYSCFLVSVLCYEISVPLVLVHYLFSIRELPRSLFRVMSFPALLCLVIFWQKIIATEVFSSDFSRLNSFSLLPLLSFFVSILVSAPLYLIEGLVEKMIMVIVCSFTFYYLLRRVSRPSENRARDSSVVLFLLIGFISNGALFLLSGRYSLVDGYQNRGLMSSWILLSLLLSSLLVKQKSWLFFFLVVLAATNFVLFADKLIESARAGDARQRIIKELIDSPQLAGNLSTSLVLDLPCVIPKANFRNEIFCTSWDARGALAHNGLKLSTVLVLGENPTAEIKELDVDAEVVLVYFDSKFRITGSERLNPESRLGLAALVESNYLKSQAQIALCESKLSDLSKFKVSGPLREYLQCAKHPLSFN